MAEYSYLSAYVFLFSHALQNMNVAPAVRLWPVLREKDQCAGST